MTVSNSEAYWVRKLTTRNISSTHNFSGFYFWLLVNNCTFCSILADLLHVEVPYVKIGTILLPEKSIKKKPQLLENRFLRSWMRSEFKKKKKTVNLLTEKSSTRVSWVSENSVIALYLLSETALGSGIPIAIKPQRGSSVRIITDDTAIRRFTTIPLTIRAAFIDRSMHFQ